AAGEGKRAMSTDFLARHVDLHLARLGDAPLRPDVSAQEIRSRLCRYDFREPHAVSDVFTDVTDMLWRWSEHAGNPAHFGLFRPAVDRTAGGAGAPAALFDPQPGAWGVLPAAPGGARRGAGGPRAPARVGLQPGAAGSTPTRRE